MREGEKALLKAWILNESQRIDNELTERRNRIRFRDIDICDCLEMLLILQRRNDFEEFARTMYRLLHLEEDYVRTE